VDFGLSDEQELLQATARDVLTREVPPGVVRETAESPQGTNESLDRKLAELGWTGLLIPESHGGLGLGTLEMAILLAEFGRAAVPGPYFASAILAATALIHAGDRQQKKHWLPKIATGEATATIAVLEKDDRLDAGGVHARARRSRSGYRLDGTKLFVPYAHVADLLIVAGRTARDAGVTLFLVDPRVSGVTIRPLETIDRTRRVSEVELRGVEVGREHVLGRVGGGWTTVATVFDVAAVALAADALGGSERVLQMAVDYSKTREQFGRPIGSFQAIKHLAAEMVADVEPARSLVWYAAHARDAIPRDASRAASMAKASLCDIYSRSANRAVQMHGGIGFTWEHDIHFWFKRAKWNEVAYGDSSFHRERVAALSGF
jgi:alkylation response protein AidB-like acyl-CoA dehydrogenase